MGSRTQRLEKNEGKNSVNDPSLLMNAGHEFTALGGYAWFEQNRTRIVPQEG